MVVCSCGNKIKYFFGIVHEKLIPYTKKYRNIFTNDVHFLCENCFKNKKEHWEKENLYLSHEGRIKKHIIVIAEINIEASTKEMFRDLLGNDIQKQINFWVPKSVINRAIKRTIKK